MLAVASERPVAASVTVTLPPTSGVVLMKMCDQLTNVDELRIHSCTSTRLAPIAVGALRIH